MDHYVMQWVSEQNISNASLLIQFFPTGPQTSTQYVICDTYSLWQFKKQQLTFRYTVCIK